MRTDSKFIAGIQRWFDDNTNLKYFKGVKSHGGKVWRKNCLPHLREELMDAVVYLSVVEDQMDKAKVMLAVALAEPSPNVSRAMVSKAYNILTTGNPEDIMEDELEENPDTKFSYRESTYG